MRRLAGWFAALLFLAPCPAGAERNAQVPERGDQVAAVDRGGRVASLDRGGLVAPLERGDDFHRGVALGLYDVNPEADYRPSIDEIAALHATHLSVIVVYFQDSVSATAIGPRLGYSPSLANVRRTLRHAKQRGLKVTLFPIVHITNRGPGDWRGKINPSDWNLWFSSYKVFIGQMAALAQDEQAEMLVVGTEYVTTETMRDRWLDVIHHVRAIFKGKLLYSANWDHFDPVSFWDAVDVAGVTAYHRLTASNFTPSVEEMTAAWEPVKRRLRAFQKRLAKPLVITEIGYPSLDGANVYPWDETRSADIDLEEQRLCYVAFTRAFRHERWLSGFYWWIWFAGGPSDRGFSPKGKPAEGVIREFFRKP